MALPNRSLLPILTLALAVVPGSGAGAATGTAPGAPSALEPGRRIFDTTLIDTEHPGGALEGTLNVIVGRSGTILGYYRAADSSRLVNVDGGLDGDRIYLNVPGFPQIYGTVSDGGFVGYTVIRGDVERFTAVPTDRQNS